MLTCQSPDSNKYLSDLILTACSYPKFSGQRREYLCHFIQDLLNSNRLWKEYSPDYEDALQDTLFQIYKDPENYDPSRAGVITWVNMLLKFRLMDYKRERYKEQKHLAALSDTDTTDFPLDKLSSAPDIPPILAETYAWIKRDANGELRKLHLRKFPHVNCQVLLLKRFPPEESWDDIAAEFGVPRSSLAMFYKRHCLKYLRQFGYQQGYLNHV